MNDRQTITEAEVSGRLPDEWSLDTDGDKAVYGYANGYAGDGAPPEDVPASFTIEHTTEMVWTAIWYTPSGLRGGMHDRESHAVGGKDRCIAWVERLARDLDEAIGAEDEDGGS